MAGSAGALPLKCEAATSALDCVASTVFSLALAVAVFAAGAGATGLASAATTGAFTQEERQASR